jgi:hypothetical protein
MINCHEQGLIISGADRQQLAIQYSTGSQHNNAITLGGKGWEIIKPVTREGRFSPRLFFLFEAVKIRQDDGLILFTVN